MCYPSSTLLAGPTQCGKTSYIFRMLRERSQLYENSQNKEWSILYCYSIYQPLYDKMEDCIPEINFKAGLPGQEDIQELEECDGRRLLILDDLAEEVMGDKKMAKLFTQGMHHREIATIIVTQNLFQQCKFSRTITLNCTYLVIFRNARDASQIKTLGSQIAPTKAHTVQDAYDDAVSKLYGYLFIDVAPSSDPRYKLRTETFPSDKYPIVFKVV